MTLAQVLISNFSIPQLPSDREGNRHAKQDVGVAVRERDIPNLDILVAPLVEQLDAANLISDVLEKNSIAARALDFDFAVRHVCDCAERRFFGEVEVSLVVVVRVAWKFEKSRSIIVVGVVAKPPLNRAHRPYHDNSTLSKKSLPAASNSMI